MKLICLYEKVSNKNYKITSQYNMDFYSEPFFHGKDYVILNDSDFPTYEDEIGFIYSYHVDINEPTKIWVEEEVRELDKDEKIKLVLDNYDNIVDLFNQVDTLNAELNLLKEKLTPPPPLGIFDNSIN